MTKNNEYILPKEKPFETVYELKNEIPSFEEFMKSYENDGNVNYDDLSVCDISINKCYGPGCKGYWPCGDSRCNGYSSDSCRTNERFHPLFTPCPAARCPDQQDPDKATYWLHDTSGCGNNGSSSRNKISDELRIRCPDCFDTTHMEYNKFTCSAHKNKHWWTSSMSFSRAFNVVYNSDLPRDMYIKILDELKTHKWKARVDDE